SSGANLGKLPIIDSRGWDEQGIHYIFRSFAERARIDEANHGNHGNQVMWRYGTGLLPGTAAQVAAVTLPSLLTMDVWLNNLNASAPKATLNSPRTQEQVIAAKPVKLDPPANPAVDFCFLPADTTFSTKVFDMSGCDAAAPGGKRRPAPPVSHPRSGHGSDHDEGDHDNGRDHHDRDDD